jgi:hypothetical protein
MKYDREYFQELAYDMEAAYKNNNTFEEAVEDVKNKNKNVNLIILWAMVHAIDAYVDININ